MENLPVNEKQPLFVRADPPRQEADLPIKIKHSAETSSEIDASFA